MPDIAAKFADDRAQGSVGYAQTMFGLHPDVDRDVLANDAAAGIAAFVAGLNIAR